MDVNIIISLYNAYRKYSLEYSLGNLEQRDRKNGGHVGNTHSHHQQPYKYHTFHAYVVVGHAARLIYLLFCFKMHLQKSFCLLDRSSLRMLYLVATSIVANLLQSLRKKLNAWYIKLI